MTIDPLLTAQEAAAFVDAGGSLAAIRQAQEVYEAGARSRADLRADLGLSPDGQGEHFALVRVNERGEREMAFRTDRPARLQR